MKNIRARQFVASLALVGTLLAGVPATGLLAAGSASTAQAATRIALDEVGGDGRVLSVSEASEVFKVKVLVDGKVRVLKIPKDTDSGKSSGNN